MLKERKNLTEGSIIRSLWALSFPVVLANLLQTAYNLTDTFWVGRLGQEAIASVSISFPILFLMISFGGGLSMAGTILVAQFAGRRESSRVDYVSAQTFLMLVMVSLILSVAGYCCSEPLVRLIGAEEAVAGEAVSYLRISFLGLIFLFGFFVFQALLRGAGDVKTPMYIVLGTVILNLGLDPLFIFGFWRVPAMGVMGAAFATVATQGLAAITGLFVLFSGRYDIHLKIRNFRPDYALLRKIVKLGLPASMEHFMMALGIMVLMFVVADFGTAVIASYGIGMRIFSFVIIPAFGLSAATSTLVGQNIGAGRVDRAEKIAVVSAGAAFAALTLVGLALFILAEDIVGLFIPDNLQVIRMGGMFVRIMSLTFGFIGAKTVFGGAFSGSGNTLLSMMLGITYFWFMRLPAAYYLSNCTSLGEKGIWIAFPAANVAGAFLAGIYFLKGTWKKREIAGEFAPFIGEI